MSNSITIAGNVGQDSELKEVGQTKVLNFNLGSNVKIKSGDIYEDKAIWVQCALWGKQGEALERYIKKGTPMTVFGEITDVSGWSDKSNNPQASIRVKAHNVKLQGGKVNTSPQTSGAPDPNDDIPF